MVRGKGEGRREGGSREGKGVKESGMEVSYAKEKVKGVYIYQYRKKKTGWKMVEQVRERVKWNNYNSYSICQN